MKRTVGKTSGTISNFDRQLMMQHAYGPEPIADEDVNSSALNWYHYMADDKQKKKWFLEVAGKNDLYYDHYLKIDDFFFTTIGTIARMRSRGFKFTEREDNSFRVLVERVQNMKIKEKPVARVVDHSLSHIIFLDEEIEKFFTFAHTTNFNFLQYMKESNLSSTVKKKIKDYFQPQLDEINKTLTGEDEDLNESWGFMGKREATRYRNLLQDIISGTHVEPTPRKKTIKQKKVKPADIQIKDLKYLERDDEHGCGSSVHPEKIIGAKFLWVWNPRYKKLGLYKSRNGIMVTGSTLKNIDADLIQRHVRKPQEFFEEFVGTQRQKEKLWEKLPGKTSPINGRINKDTLLLSVQR